MQIFFFRKCVQSIDLCVNAMNNMKWEKEHRRKLVQSFAGHDYLAAFGAELGIPLHHTTRVVDTCNHAGQASKCINRHKHICVCTCTPTNAYTNVGVFTSMSIGQSYVHTNVIPHTHMVTHTHEATHRWVICKIDEFLPKIDFPIHGANDKNFDDFF